MTKNGQFLMENHVFFENFKSGHFGALTVVFYHILTYFGKILGPKVPWTRLDYAFTTQKSPILGHFGPFLVVFENMKKCSGLKIHEKSTKQL